MTWVGFEPTIPVFERAKTVHALDRVPTVMACPTKIVFWRWRVCVWVQKLGGVKYTYLCNILSDERIGLSITIAAVPRQRSLSQIQVPRDSRSLFTVSDLRLSQAGGPGPCIYIPQEHGGPVIPPGIRFPFRRLLRLAGLQWRYSNPPPHVW
jgi:hypothetical protein